MTLTTTLDVDPAPDRVLFHVHVHNEGTDPVDVQFRSAMTADVAVLDDGEEVWRWSEGQMFAQMLQSETYEAGETETFEFEWPDPEPGTYEAVAEVNTVDGMTATEGFTV